MVEFQPFGPKFLMIRRASWNMCGTCVKRRSALMA
jgi:hypothetical protein